MLCIRHSSQFCNQVCKIQVYFCSRDTELSCGPQLYWAEEVSNPKSIQGHPELCQGFMGIILRKEFDSRLGSVASAFLSGNEGGMLGGIFRSRNFS